MLRAHVALVYVHRVEKKKGGISACYDYFLCSCMCSCITTLMLSFWYTLRFPCCLPQVCGCMYLWMSQQGMDILKVRPDRLSWPRRCGWYFSEETESKSSPTTALYCHTSTTEVGAVSVGVCAYLCACMHESCTSTG